MFFKNQKQRGVKRDFMKRVKKLFVFLFALVVMFGFTNTVKADSYDSSNEMKGKIVVRTTINNWSSTNDLVYDVDVNNNFVNDTDGWLYSNNNYILIIYNYSF